MRSRICHALVLLALPAACQTIPENLKVEVDGRHFEITKKPAAPDAGDDELR